MGTQVQDMTVLTMQYVVWSSHCYYSEYLGVLISVLNRHYQVVF